MAEFAVILPLLVMFVVGIADFGRYAYASIEVANAALAGARYGAQNSITACDKAGMVAAATADAANIAGMTVTASGNSTNCSANALCACSNNLQTLAACNSSAITGCTSPNRVIQYVKVVTSATIRPIFKYPGFPASLTLKGQATMRTDQ